jgi:hypothetical protein
MTRGLLIRVVRDVLPIVDRTVDPKTVAERGDLAEAAGAR